jgi:hypothetical protein
VTLIVYYVVFMVIGDFAAYFLGSLLCVPVGVLDTCRSFHEAKIG